MPDRLPPSWGHEPKDGRDLGVLLPAQAPLSVEEIQTDEALLSGQLAGISDSQRPVAGAMFALRAAPEGSELAGEAAARAAFRALMTPAGPELHQTLVLPVPAARQGARPPARHRHRHRRPAAGRRSWHAAVIAGSAAAVVVIGAVAAAAIGLAGHRGQPSGPSAAHLSASASASASKKQSVLGNGQPTKDATQSTTPEASATPGATASPSAASEGSALCREYFSYRHAVHGAAKREIFQKLIQLAGTDSFFGVVNYCNELDSHLFTMPPKPPSHETWRFPGSESGGGNGAPDAGAGADQAGSGQATSGQTNSGQGNGGSGDSGSGSGGSR